MAMHQLVTSSAQETALAYVAQKAGLTTTQYLQQLAEREALNAANRQYQEEQAAMLATYAQLTPEGRAQVKATADQLKPQK